MEQPKIVRHNSIVLSPFTTPQGKEPHVEFGYLSEIKKTKNN